MFKINLFIFSISYQPTAFPTQTFSATEHFFGHWTIKQFETNASCNKFELKKLLQSKTKYLAGSATSQLERWNKKCSKSQLIIIKFTIPEKEICLWKNISRLLMTLAWIASRNGSLTGPFDKQNKLELEQLNAH